MNPDKVREWGNWFNVLALPLCLFMGKDVMGACITALSSFGTINPDGRND